MLTSEGNPEDVEEVIPVHVAEDLLQEGEISLANDAAFLHQGEELLGALRTVHPHSSHVGIMAEELHQLEILLAHLLS